MPLDDPAEARLEHCIDAARSPRAANAWLTLDEQRARDAARAADRAIAEGRDPGRLGGLVVSVKDLFDVAGEVTTAGSTVLAGRPPAVRDAPAVARLRAAGAALLGRTNMTEFAYSGVGINPHHGTPVNAAYLEPPRDRRIPGGSTSGGATTVASGSAWAALGSDTGGSIRIPAALQGLVGFKSTARLVPTDGAVPLSTTLDTVAGITRSVGDAVMLHEVLASRRVVPDGRGLRELAFAVPRRLFRDGLDAAVGASFDNALARLRAAGARIAEIELPLVDELAALNADGGFSALESWAWHRELLAAHGDRYDPRVAARIRRGEAIDDGKRKRLVAGRAGWITRMSEAMAPFDALLSPTVPIVAPRLAPLLADDAAFFAANAALLRNPSAVNVLDGCALSLPCHEDGAEPVGLMLWHGALHDDTVLAASLAVEAALAAAPA